MTLNSIIARCERIIGTRAIEAMRYLRDQSRDEMSRDYPPASKPGEYPAKRTGRLRASIKATANKGGAVLTTNVNYAVYLHNSGRKMPLETYWERRKQLQNIMKGR